VTDREITITLALIAAVVIAALTALLLMTGNVGASVRPAKGYPTYNASLCGPNAWVRVKLPDSEYTVHDSATACITSEEHHLDFRVTSVSARVPWQYPNISSGYETGESSCATPADTCYQYPVQQRDDGMPVASVGAWLPAGFTGNLSFDTWFSPSADRTSYADRSGDTEVMIWLDHPGEHDAAAYDWSVTIDGVRWGVMSWIAGYGSAHAWRYVAYLAPRTSTGQVNVSDLWLNPFWRNVEQHGYLTPDDYLTAIDLGAEITGGGPGFNIHRYDLSGVG
jgi:hypothetical protein